MSQTQEAPLSDVDSLVQSECKFLNHESTAWNIITNRASVLDNPSVIHGMPVSLQLVGRRLEEEKVIMMGEVILEAL